MVLCSWSCIFYVSELKTLGEIDQCNLERKILTSQCSNKLFLIVGWTIKGIFAFVHSVALPCFLRACSTQEVSLHYYWRPALLVVCSFNGTIDEYITKAWPYQLTCCTISLCVCVWFSYRPKFLLSLARIEKGSRTSRSLSHNRSSVCICLCVCARSCTRVSAEYSLMRWHSSVAKTHLTACRMRSRWIWEWLHLMCVS